MVVSKNACPGRIEFAIPKRRAAGTFGVVIRVYPDEFYNRLYGTPAAASTKR